MPNFKKTLQRPTAFLPPSVKILIAMKNLLLLLFVSTCAWAQDGTLDTSFGDDGLALIIPDLGQCTSTTYPSAVDFAQLTNGDLLIGIFNFCSISSQDSQNLLTRTGPDGTVDPEFGDNGYVEVDFSLFLGVAEQAENQHLAFGRTGSTSPTYQIHRFLDDERDYDFGVDGVLEMPEENFSLANFVVLEDQSILVWGNSPSSIKLLKFDPNGNPDLSFGNNGMREFNTSFYPRAQQAKELANGDLLMLYSSTSLNPSQVIMTKISNNGELIDEYGQDGFATFNIDFDSEFSGLLASFDVLSDGSAYLIGERFLGCLVNRFHIKLNPDGSPASFGIGGVKIFGESDLVSNKMVLQDNDRIFITSSLENCVDSIFLKLSRYYTSGHLDPSFEPDHFLLLYPEKSIIHQSGFIYTLGTHDIINNPDNAVVLIRFFNNPLNTDEQSHSTFIISPNPSTGIFRIYSTNNDLTGTDYQVADISGKIILEGVLENEIDLGFAEGGIYFLKLAGQTHKLLKK